MDAEWLRSHWALGAAAVAVGLVAVALLVRTAAASGPARLFACRRRLARERRGLRRAARAVVRAEHRLRGLLSRAERIKPRLIDEAKGALEDARALERIARDRVQVAENHVRRVILEEFAPARQAKLRVKYLPERPADRRPFSF